MSTWTGSQLRSQPGGVSLQVPSAEDKGREPGGRSLWGEMKDVSSTSPWDFFFFFNVAPNMCH